MIAIGLSKKKAFDVDLKAIQQISFTGNLEEQSTIFFIIEEGKETVLGIWKMSISFWYNINIKMTQTTR